MYIWQRPVAVGDDGAGEVEWVFDGDGFQFRKEGGSGGGWDLHSQVNVLSAPEL